VSISVEHAAPTTTDPSAWGGGSESVHGHVQGHVRERVYVAAMALRRRVASLLAAICAEQADDIGRAHADLSSSFPEGARPGPPTGLPAAQRSEGPDARTTRGTAEG
jgi:hypothetical protein